MDRSISLLHSVLLNFPWQPVKKPEGRYKRNTFFIESPSVAHFEWHPSERCPLIPTTEPFHEHFFDKFLSTIHPMVEDKSSSEVRISA